MVYPLAYLYILVVRELVSEVEDVALYMHVFNVPFNT